MSLQQLVEPFPWYRYSKKLKNKINTPHSCGYFTKNESEERGVRLAKGYAGSIEDGNALIMFWLVDPDDGIVIDAKFQAYGQTALIGAADAACELCVGKNYDQCRRLSTELIDRHLRDKIEESAFPRETFAHLNLTLDAIDQCADQCMDIPLPVSYSAPPIPTGLHDIKGEAYPGWIDLPLQKKIAVIEQVLDSDVRPYIALDAGGVEVINLIDNKEVIISYSGTCTSCYSSIGTTLSYIQQILRAKVHPELKVTPDMLLQ